MELLSLSAWQSDSVANCILAEDDEEEDEQQRQRVMEEKAQALNPPVDATSTEVEDQLMNGGGEYCFESLF